jgi:Tol biopolymer transport system component
MKAATKSRPWPALAAVLAVLCVFSAEAAQLVSQRSSISAPPAGGNGDSGMAIVSADGRYVLFASSANNLVLTNNNNFVLPRRMNVFLHDRSNDVMTLVSVNLAGNGGGNGDSFPRGISTDGQFALFESSASDLVPNDTNNASDVFVRDVINGTTTLVSVNTNGGIANGASHSSVMTLDGRYVAFVSAASNLVANDANNIADVFVRDLQMETTTLVSVGAESTVSTNTSESPEITPDGRYVAFYSTATNLVPGVGTSGEVYVRDLLAGNTIWASADARAIFQSTTGSTNEISCNYNISDDGNYVAFEACTNPPSGSCAFGIILRYSLQTGLTDIIYTNANVLLSSFENIHNLAMTPDGRFVAFVVNVGGASGTNTAIYVWDTQSGTSTLVSADLNNSTVPANGICDSPMISTNGQFVTFTSTGGDLVTNSLAGDCHVYIRDMEAGVTQLLDTDTNGVGLGVNSTTVPALSADGSIVAFDSRDLLSDNRHENYDVFARDISENCTDLISARNCTLPSQTPDGISSFTLFSASTNGRYLAFYSDADDLALDDTNGYRDVFVRDLLFGTNILISVNTNGISGDGVSTEPAISADGRYVAFTSSANDLVPGDTNNAQNVFVRDLQNGTTMLVSASADGIHTGNGDSYSPQISANGRYVLFHSKASNLAAGSFGSGIENLFFRDMQIGTNYALTSAASGTGAVPASMTSDGSLVAFIGTAFGTSGTKLYVWNSQTRAIDYTSSTTFSSGLLFPVVSISPLGQEIVYLASASSTLTAVYWVRDIVSTVDSGTFPSHIGLQFNNDGRFLVYSKTVRNTNQVYLYDFLQATNSPVSQSFNLSGLAYGNSDSPVISPDGNFVAYRSFASNIVSNDFNNVGNVFIYDRSNATTIILSASDSGDFTANDFSLKPVFSGDGQTLFFTSWASDLIANDFNNGSDLFALNVSSLPGGAGTTNSASIFYAQISPSSGFGQGGQNPLISWPLISGKTYQAQFKNDLSDPDWQDLPGDIVFIGNTGYISDPSPASGQKFYRILLNP